MLKCQNCSINFDTLSRIPRILQCGDTFCSLCLQSFVLDGNFICPKDQNISTYRPIETITINLSILESVKNNELRCYSHPERISIKIDLNNGLSFCEDCSKGDYSSIDYDELKELLIKSLKRLSNMPKISEEYRKLLIEYCSRKSSAKNTDRLELLRNLIFMSNTIFCDSEKHEPKQAFYMNFYSKQVLCQECKVCEDQNFEMILNENFKDLLIRKISWIRRAANTLEGKLACDYQNLPSMPLKSLIFEYQSLDQKEISGQVIQKQNKCKDCGSVFSLSNEPWVFPCIGSHILCSNCVSGKDYINCPYCSIDIASYNLSSMDPLYSFENKIPCCPYCKNPYDLKVHLPKEFPCGHVLCLYCLKLNYLEVSPRVTRCKSCSSEIGSLKSLPSSMFLIKKVQASIVSCSKHRNRSASCIEVITLRSWCSKCEKALIKSLFLFKIHREEMKLTTFLLTLYRKLSKDPHIELKSSEESFKKLSCQQMLDELRVGVEPQLAPQLFSTMPKGREIQDSGHLINKCLLFRFLSLMPPEKTEPKFDYICRPWTVDCKKNQVESISFKSNRNIQLEGVIVAQGIYDTLISIKKVEIIHGNSLSNSNPRLFSHEIEVELNRKQYQKLEALNILNESDHPVHVGFPPNCNEHEIAYVRFNPTIKILAGEFYSILIQLSGEKVLLFRGNQLEIKEEFWGSDGTLFHFAKVTDLDKYYIEGQHELTGPILGLIYD